MIHNSAKKLTILMPSLNEEESIGQVIDCIPLAQLREAGYDPDILLVDGGSLDQTVAIARRKNVRVLNSPPGYGKQIRAGLDKAEGDIIIIADSDCSYPLEESLSMVSLLEKEKLDFISANRFANLERGSMHPVNRLGNWLLTALNNLLFGFNLKDSQSGMWVVTKDALSRIKFTCDDWSFSQEIKIQAFSRLKAREVDSRYKKRMGTVKLRRFRDGLRVMLQLFKTKLTG